MLLELDCVSSGYGPLPALHEVSLSVGIGEIVALIGANGAGKSTLLNTVMGLVAVSAGDIRFDDRAIAHWPTPSIVRAGIAQVPERRQLFGSMSVEENPTEVRNAFYYARELSFHSKWAEAIAQAERYLAMPKAVWPNERCYAMRVIGRCYQELGDWTAALKWHRMATNEAPDTREPWAELASICYRLSRWPEALGAALCCLDIKNREKVYTVDPAVWGSQPHDTASIAAYNMGLYDLALEHARKAVEIDGSDLRLRQNLKFCEDKVKAA